MWMIRPRALGRLYSRSGSARFGTSEVRQPSAITALGAALRSTKDWKSVCESSSGNGGSSSSLWQGLLQAMDDVTLADTGLSVHGLTSSQYALCMNLGSCEQEQWHAALFLIPAGSTIPLHDHPGMTVLSTVLHGRLGVTSYTKGAAVSSNGGGTWQCQLHETAERSVMDSTWSISARRGNVHSFSALGGECALVLDVLLPPYDERAGRGCSYYNFEAAVEAKDKEQGRGVLRGLPPGHEPSLLVYNGDQLYPGPMLS